MTRTDPRPGLPARYSSTCARCHGPIGVGDRIAHLRGAYIHVGCAAGSDDK